MGLQQMAKDFAEKEIAPRAAEIDKQGKFPQELFNMVTHMGFTGLCVPEEYGGSDAGSSENARFVTNLALQIHGGYGYMRDTPFERMYRDAKLTEIYEGTSEIQKVDISRAVLG